MKTITQRELRNNSAAVMDAVEAGESFHISRNGIEVAELRPLAQRRRFVPVEELQRRWQHLPSLSYEEMRAEADEFFGSEDRLGEEGDDPWERRRG
jgi:prevent-host-death family protein